MMRRWPLFALCLGACAAPAPAPPPITVPLPKPAPPAREQRGDPARGPNGERAEIAGRRVTITLPSGATERIEPGELHAEPGDPSLRGLGPTAALFLSTGALMVGASDGTIHVLGGDRRRRASLGLRGAIRGLSAAGEGLVAATTDLGVMALLTSEGRLRWERSVTGEPLGAPLVVMGKEGQVRAVLSASERAVFAVAPSGEHLFSHASPQLASQRVPPSSNDDWAGYKRPTQVPHGAPPVLSIEGDMVRAGANLRFRLDDPHPEAPSLTPVFPLTFRRVLPGTVTSLLAGGPGEVWALVRKATSTGEAEPLLPPFVSPFDRPAHESERYELVHVEGSRVTRLPVPHQGARKEIFLAGTKRREAGSFWIDGLTPGPGGRPWILARRISQEASPGGSDGDNGPQYGAGQVLEIRGSAVRERDAADALRTGFFEHIVYEPIAAGRGLFCFGSKAPVCAAVGEGTPRLLPSPGRVVAVAEVGRSSVLLTSAGELHRRVGDQYTSLAAPEGGVLYAVGGASEADLWGEVGEPFHVVRFDGREWARVPLPADVPNGFVARATDDVWTGNGQARWDGQRWSRVFGAAPASAVVAVSRDEVWLGGEGLWRGTAPGPAAVQLPVAREEASPAAATPLILGPPALRYSVQRTRLPLGKGEDLASANHVSAAPDGSVWLQRWDRLVEVSEGRARSLREVRRHDLGRWAQPEGKGRGHLIERGSLRRLDRADAEEVQLDRHRAVALHTSAQGITWLVGTPESPSYAEPNPYEHSPHALVVAGGAPRPVLGLPSAAYCDVAATEDGGAWFAGGLSPGPSGEGILFHARGRLGVDSAARIRAPATLFAVAALGADEAWAVGAAGTIVHVRGAAIRRLTLPSGAWLRAVFAATPDDVWIGGDAGTLVHYDGQSFQPVAHPLGPGATITAIAMTGGVVWVVGPSGILRIRKSN